MNNDSRTVHEIVNSAVADLLLVDASDKGPLGGVISKMEQVSGSAGIPEALVTMAKRIAKLAEFIIMETTPFEEGFRQLSDGLSKMAQNAGTYLVNEENAGAPPGERNPGETGESGAPADMVELFTKFGQQLLITLEDFEMYVLEYEKGAQEALQEIKRMLHTWKGEFGVLDIKDHVDCIHSLEERILSAGSADTDELFRFKDLLESAAEKMKSGMIPLLPEQYRITLASTGGEQHSQQEAGESIGVVETADEAQTDSGEEEIGANADKGLLADFVTEAHDHIHRSETLLLELEVDPSKMEHINTIFRACHTIKGVAGFLSLKTLTKVAHSTENLMDQVRKGALALTPQRIDLLFEAMDCLKEMIAAVAGAIEGIPFEVPESASYIIGRLEASSSGEAQPAQAVYREKRVGEMLVEQGSASERQVECALKKQLQGDERPIGELLIEEKVPPRVIGKALAAQTKAKTTAVEVEDTIRVPVKRLDMLIDAIGEGVIAQSMVYANGAVAQLKDIALEKKIAQSMLIMRQIQEMSMSLRMVALRSTFQKMARLVRDLSKKVGKDVEFAMEGEDTELDKSVVENIGDPLIHMLRNSLDHGIESADERSASGKPQKARITIRAYHKAGNVCIEIEDDGRGLDREKIRGKAIERGLCKQSEQLSDQEVYQFIFMPGFSTAAVVTDISGRGVGMDVVQRNISALRGAIDIQSEQGKGTLFTIRLPLTLAIINGMVIRLNNERYIVPTLSILESILPEKNQIETVVGREEVLKVRGELVRLIRLEELFFGAGTGSRDKEGIALVVEDAMGRNVALYVDEIIDQQQVVIKSLGEGVGDIPGVSGGAIMSDGTISLILDIAGIMRIAAE